MEAAKKVRRNLKLLRKELFEGNPDWHREEYPRRVKGKEWLNWLAHAYYTIKEAPYYHSRAIIATGEVLIPTMEHFEKVYGKDLAEVNRDIVILHELTHLKIALVIGEKELDYHGKQFQAHLKAVLEEYQKQRDPPLTEAERNEVRKHLQFYLNSF